MSTGIVQCFDPKRGFGFIKDDSDPDGRPLFFYYKSILMDGFKIVYESDVVSFDRVQAPKGPRAENIRPLT